MNTKDKTYTPEQNLLIAELAATYGIEPEEIIFFQDDPRPLFTYEATCVLCNRLANLKGINIEPIENGFADSIAFRCRLVMADNATRSAVGVANTKETIDGQPMTDVQSYQMASGRAIRNALRVAGIDLLKLHNQAVHGNVTPIAAKSNRAKLIAQAHLLGQEAGLIVDDSKTGWQTLLTARYGVSNSNELSDDLLADFVAVLKVLVPAKRAA